jgi:FkbM family methyltransferase
MRSVVRRITKETCRFYPLYSGCGTIASLSFFQSISQTSDPLVMTKLRDGSSIFVRLDDFVGRAIYYFGDLDPKITWICQRVLRPGDTMLDIGANCGVVTLYSSKLVGATGQVHAFEPQQNLAELIQKAAEINVYSQISVHNIALSENDGVLNIEIPAGNSGAASLSRQRTGKTIQVQVKRTADYLSSLGLRTIRLMKLDVEGHEAEVLRGGLNFFSKCKPDVIVFESNETTEPFWERAAIRLLESLDYAIFEILKSKFCVQVRHLERETDALAQVSGHDFVAVKRGVSYNSIISAFH